MSGNLYSAVFDAKAVTGAIDLFEMTATTRTFAVHALRVWQTTDVGDAAEEILRIEFRRASTAGSGGTAVTEHQYVDDEDVANDTTVIEYATGGTSSTGGELIDIIPWNIRIPLVEIWTPEMRPRIDSNSDPLSIRFAAAPADSITMGAAVIWEEF
jgi:hypothetical protein